LDVRSLGYRTDLIFAGFDGEIIDRGDFVVVRTPSNPTYYWGNFLLFSDPPQTGDFERWRRLFRQEIGGPPIYEHQTFGWDSPQAGNSEPFLDAGFHLSHNVVMRCVEPRRPAHYADFIEMHPLKTRAEREAAIELQVLCREPGHDAASYRAFRARQMDRYQAMAGAGLGEWYGAFVGGQLVANLGLFKDGKLGRYQAVETHPEFRRRGIAGTLVFEAGRQAIGKYGLQTLVIVAEDQSGASHLYASTGFEPVEPQWGLEWWPVSDG
jgi:ribosomal protein S18 acetylase RimI-like enzyme